MEKKLKEIEVKLRAINSIITKLDPAIKLAAFEVLKLLLLKNSLETGPTNKNIPTTEGGTSGDVRDFYASFNPTKPADSVLVLAGWLYTQRGSTPFTLTELRDLINDVGVPMPDRIDMTLRNCTRNGKKLFQRAGQGDYRPTVHGENFFKSEMNLKPGKKL